MNTAATTIHGRFEEMARRYPARLAVVGQRHALSYARLDELASRLAQRLSATGIRARARVVVCLSRSPEAIVAMIAVLKAGATYVPMDPSYPLAVKQAYISQIGAQTLLVDEDGRGAIDGHELATIRISIDALLGSAAAYHRSCDFGEDEPAYIMFTSGSTGEPKAVLIPHRGVVRLVIETNYIDLTDDVLLQLSPLTFDASTFEIWGALLNGGRLVLYEGEVFDVNALSALLVREGVTVMWLTAALLHLVARRSVDMLGGLRVLLAGGDVLHPKAVKAALLAHEKLTVINGYGPTENTTFTCCHVMTSDTELADSIPIGQPITGTTVQVRDTEGRLVTKGAVGELYAGGRGVALGYVNAPELSRIAFVDDPLEPGKRLYRTGDLVREISDGVYEFIGRADNQIKIRGYRISLDAVQRALTAIAGVEDGVVCVERDSAGEKQLTAFVQSQENPERMRHAVREELARSVPRFMIPDLILVQRQLPVTLNGKLDRRKLFRQRDGIDGG